MPDLTTEYSPEKGWLTRQFENAKRDVAEWPEWMRKESGRMKTDMTTAEMRDIQVELVELLSVQNKPMKRWSPLLDILDEAIARREREESGDNCPKCGHSLQSHDCRGKCYALNTKPFSWCTCEDSPVTDGEAG